MSVLVPEKEVFEAIYTKAVDYTYRRTCDVNYSYVFGYMTEKQIKGFVKDIAHLNEWSYNKRYEHHDDVSKEITLPDTLDLKFKGKTIDTVQMLKYLECIRYQIEIETIKKGYHGDQCNLIPQHLMDSYETLNRAIGDIKSAIVKHYTNYEEKKWCEA